jgi:hypothetical protein
MSKVVYISKSSIERQRGPLRIAHLPGEPQPVVYSVHGEIAEHYKVDPAKLTESHASTIDSVISATPVECWALSEARWKRDTLMPAMGN